MNNKNYQYYNNRNAYGNICIPRREEILNYLIKEKFLSEFKTNEEKQQVLYNLGILQIIDNLLDQINTKIDIQQLQNYVTLQQFLDKVEELKPHDEKSKGYYSSIEQLIQEYPTGEKGDWAIVNVEGNWYIYRYDNIQGWIQSGTYDISVDLTGYVTQDLLDFYQRILVSGQNIKTINGESILGPGNIEILSHQIKDLRLDKNQQDINEDIYNEIQAVKDSGGNNPELYEEIEALSQRIQELEQSPRDLVEHIFLTQEEYDSLTTYKKDTLYIIVEHKSSEGSGSCFGDTFPLIFGENSSSDYSSNFGGTFPLIFT